MNNNSCASCSDAERQARIDFENIKNEAKKQASQEQKPKAVCFDQVNGYFITDAGTAIASGYIIKEFISAVQ